MIVLVTGAGGRTGQTIVPTLIHAGHTVRILSRRTELGGPWAQIAAERRQGDLGNDADVAAAMQGVDALYHIPPNMNPQEVAFGQRLVALARQAKLKHVVYHSVLHPQIQALPHHWNKVFVEEAVLESGLNFTILQPSSYMQNVLQDWEGITQRGVHTLGFSVQARLSLVDLQDVADVAAKVIGNPDHFGAVYELAGPEMLSGEDKARVLSQVLGRAVRAVEESLVDFRRRALAAGMPPHVVETRASMFAHYDHQGLVGNSNVLRWVLGRAPTTFEGFLRRHGR